MKLSETIVFKVMNDPPFVWMRGENYSKALDAQSMYWANYLLGNPANSPTMEISIGNLQLQALASTTVAVTGGDIPFFINGVRMAKRRTHRVQAGDTLRFNYFKKRLRTYLAVQGGFSTVLFEKGEEMHNLRRKDFLFAKTTTQKLPNISGFIAKNHWKHLSFSNVLRVVLKSNNVAEEKRETIKNFFARSYKISYRSNSWNYFLLPREPCISKKTAMQIKMQLEHVFSTQRRLLAEERNGEENFADFPALHGGEREYKVALQAKTLNEKKMFDENNIGNETNADKNDELNNREINHANTVDRKSFLCRLLPIDAYKLAQLPPDEVVAFWPIHRKEAEKIMERFQRFFMPAPNGVQAEHAAQQTIATAKPPVPFEFAV